MDRKPYHRLTDGQETVPQTRTTRTTDGEGKGKETDGHGIADIEF